MSFSWSKFVELMVIGNSTETLCVVMYIEISRCYRVEYFHGVLCMLGQIKLKLYVDGSDHGRLFGREIVCESGDYVNRIKCGLTTTWGPANSHPFPCDPF